MAKSKVVLFYVPLYLSITPDFMEIFLFYSNAPKIFSLECIISGNLLKFNSSS